MSLEFTLTALKPVEVFERNITSNLGSMAREAGLFEVLWEPEKLRVNSARDLVPTLKKGLRDLKAKPEHFKQFEAKNGWGTFEDFVSFVEAVLDACLKNPTAVVESSS